MRWAIVALAVIAPPMFVGWSLFRAAALGEFLNDDGTIFSVELLRDTDADEPTFSVTVKRNNRTDRGDRTRIWTLVNESTLTTDRLVQS